jgi:hypothetical protein
MMGGAVVLADRDDTVAMFAYFATLKERHERHER